MRTMLEQNPPPLPNAMPSHYIPVQVSTSHLNYNIYTHITFGMS